MATGSYHHGVRVTEVNDGTNSLKIISTAIIGMVCTAEDADPVTFPLNTAVLITNVDASIGKAGVKGTLARALTRIKDQCRPVIVVVRVADGVGASPEDKALDQTAKVIGSTQGNQFTGMQALRTAEVSLGVKPRILGTPGLGNQDVDDALASVAEKVNGFAYAACQGDDIAEAQDYRQNFGQRELMVIWPGWKAMDIITPAALVEIDGVATALGLRAKIDQEIGWHKTISNVPVNGVRGITRDVDWALQSSDTAAGILNSKGITTLIRRNGFRYWGSRTCATEENFVFESAVRTGQVLKDTMADGHFWAVDKPLHPSLVKDILEGMNAKFRELTALGYILGAQAWYDETVNETASLKSGKLTLDFDYTPVPPAEDIELRQRISDRYFDDFALRVNAA